MKLRKLITLVLAASWLCGPALTEVPPTTQAAGSAIQAPVLKWAGGGCDLPWCETGWYSSPAVADLDGDGTQEIVAASYSVFILNGADGTLVKEIDAAGGRQWPSLVVADLEGDGDLEILTAHGDGYLNVYDHAGNTVWSRQATPGNELRSLAVYDLDANRDLEIIIASTRSADQWDVYEHNNVRRSGSWPQHYPDSDTNGYTAGCYNENIAAGDLDGDGLGEIVGPNDTHYLAAFQDDGVQMPASPIYGTLDGGALKPWSRVGVHVDHSVDLRGYADCGVEHRPNFASSAPIIVDVNQDGVLETVVVGNVYNCGTSPYTDLYEIPYILNADRTRWQGSGFDWTVLPIPDGQAAPLSQDYTLIESSQPNPAAADLDGDHRLEIVFPSYDGRVHAFWLDKTEHGNWPYSVYDPAEGFYRFASEPAIADLDANGQAEVIFVSWPEKGSGATGKLHILDSLGNRLHEVNLPANLGSSGWDGALAAPTLANIDADPDLEVVVNTAHSGVAAYDLPGTSGAHLLWATGRGSYLRSGSLGSLTNSTKRASQNTAVPGETISFTITLHNPGPLLPTAALTDTLPAGMEFAGGLSASSGALWQAGNVVYWSGEVPTNQPVQISYQAQVDLGFVTGALVNRAVISSGWQVLDRQAIVLVNPSSLYLPHISR